MKSLNMKRKDRENDTDRGREEGRGDSDTYTHTDTFMHKYLLLLGNIPCESFISFCFLPTPTSAL